VFFGAGEQGEWSRPADRRGEAHDGQGDPGASIPLGSVFKISRGLGGPGERGTTSPNGRPSAWAFTGFHLALPAAGRKSGHGISPLNRPSPRACDIFFLPGGDCAPRWSPARLPPCASAWGQVPGSTCRATARPGPDASGKSRPRTCPGCPATPVMDVRSASYLLATPLQLRWPSRPSHAAPWKPPLLKPREPPRGELSGGQPEKIGRSILSSDTLRLLQAGP